MMISDDTFSILWKLFKNRFLLIPFINFYVTFEFHDQIFETQNYFHDLD